MQTDLRIFFATMGVVTLITGPYQQTAFGWFFGAALVSLLWWGQQWLERRRARKAALDQLTAEAQQQCGYGHDWHRTTGGLVCQRCGREAE